MSVVRISVHIGILYMFYAIGVWIQKTLNLFIPGSVIGMILFLALLLSGKYNPRWTEEGAQFLIRHLPLLFLPITVGLIDYLDLFKGSGIWIVFVVLFSTVLVMVTSGKTTDWLAQKRERDVE